MSLHRKQYACLKSSVRSKAFTLVELLVVIAIIVMLVVIIAPLIKKGQSNARFATCKSNLKQIGSGIIMFAGDNHDVMPGVDDDPYVGDARWQKSWLGSEVASPGYAVPWCDPDHIGTISFFLNLTDRGAVQVYRCPALRVSEIGSGGGSNGMFDYTYVQALAGANLSTVIRIATLLKGTTDEQGVPTPMLVEEDPDRGANQSPIKASFADGDRLGSWHDGRGSYVAIDGSVQTFDVNDLQVGRPIELKDYQLQMPSGQFISIYQDSIEYGEWFQIP